MVSDKTGFFGWFRTVSDGKYHTFRVLTLLNSYCTFTELSEIFSYLSYSVLKCLIFRFERLIIRVHVF